MSGVMCSINPTRTSIGLTVGPLRTPPRDTAALDVAHALASDRDTWPAMSTRPGDDADPDLDPHPHLLGAVHAVHRRYMVLARRSGTRRNHRGTCAAGGTGRPDRPRCSGFMGLPPCPRWRAGCCTHARGRFATGHECCCILCMAGY